LNTHPNTCSEEGAICRVTTAPAAAPRPRASAKRPALDTWLQGMLRSEFFCPCATHLGFKKNEVRLIFTSVCARVLPALQVPPPPPPPEVLPTAQRRALCEIAFCNKRASKQSIRVCCCAPLCVCSHDESAGRCNLSTQQ
jgi:hypothetical protein